MTSDVNKSKRIVKQLAAKELGGNFDVICSTHEFSYLANSRLFCETKQDNVICLALLHHVF
jgi:hypothetical protein